MQEFIIENLEDEVLVHELKPYEEHSVLAGQEQKCFIEVCDTLEIAKKAYPKAEVLDYVYRPNLSGLGDCPPDWFDEANAGETW
jgi:hypothetical protein